MSKENNKEKSKNQLVLQEEKILDFWDKAETFKKSVKNPPQPKGRKVKEKDIKNYVFYDGPPFGTGEPHYGHILSSISKDVVPRYWTMRGYRVERRWGWDCHGLPIENIIEKDMDINGKKQIEEIGIDKFNESCRARVLEYADTWDVMIRRIARWVDFKNSYKTMDPEFMESVWWAFKELWKKDLIYQGRKVLLYCPRCETPISNFEVAMDNSYKDISETSVYVKFRLSDKSKKENKALKDLADKDIFILAWTTTPWTLPGNVALAVGSDIDYVLIKSLEFSEEADKKDKKIDFRKKKQGYYILAKDRIREVFGEKDKEIIKKFKGSELIDLEYKPLFEVPKIKNSGQRAYYVASADFVTTEEGTGVVHTAVVYGEDDYNLGVKLNLPVIPALDEKGHFNDTVPQFKGLYFKAADKLIISDLLERGLLYKKEEHSHSYPFCHRCDTQLFYNAIPAWFINIGKLRQKMLEQNEKINWYPEHLKHGRFAQGIEQAPDWNISRNRYFATPIPIWECSKCHTREVIGSIEELKEKSGKKEIKDIHNHFIDDLQWSCPKCSGQMKRISEVFDCWVESGSMSFAQHHYPFENKEKFEKTFPAQYITEYISQTRAWFYVMHVMSTALFESNSFENVVTTGVILNEKGEKMSKSKKNYPDPWKMINEFGVDALRVYLMSSSVMHADNLYFNERDLRDIFRKNMMILWNVLKFYSMFSASAKSSDKEPKGNHLLDRWILARLKQLKKEVTENMDNYNLPRAIRPTTVFIDDLSTWYIRRSRERFKSDNAEDKERAIETTAFVLQELSKLIAPFMPFIAEYIWQTVTGHNFEDNDKSVHLEAWPEVEKFDEDLLATSVQIRKIVELGLACRVENKIKVRQPLNELRIKNYDLKKEFKSLLMDELNVKNISSKKGKGEISVDLDTKITEELKLEGIKRELVRTINNMRKKNALTIKDKIEVFYQGSKVIQAVIDKFNNELCKETLAEKFNLESAEITDGKELKMNGEEIKILIKKK